MKLKDILVVKKYLFMFPNDLPNLLPDRYVEFIIDLIPGVVSISMVLFRMAPLGLRELKV